MADVKVSVAGKPYLLACEAGEEAHLETLAGLIDAEAHALAGKLTQPPGEARMLLMAALMVADRLHEAEGEITRLQGEVSELADAAAAAEAAAREAAAKAPAEAPDPAPDPAPERASDTEPSRRFITESDDLFQGAADAERARRIVALAERIERLTEALNERSDADEEDPDAPLTLT